MGPELSSALQKGYRDLPVMGNNMALESGGGAEVSVGDVVYVGEYV